jgi:hypothetical protein
MTNSEATDLSMRMRARADADGLPSTHPLRIAADKFDSATDGFFAKDQTVNVMQFMGHWSRARRAWCDYSGEDLI